MTRAVVICALASALAAAPAGAQQEQDWPVFSGDSGATKYSSLDTINRSNVSRLKVAWQWKADEGPIEEFKAIPGLFQATPIMIDGVLYFSTPLNRVVAIDAETGTQKWIYDPKAYADGPVPNGTGFVHRGVAAWTGHDGRLRIFMNSRNHLIVLDAATGKPDAAFGDNGVIDLTKHLLFEINPKHYTNTSPPLVYKDLVIVGNGVADRLVYKGDPPGDVRAWHAKTGKFAWSFHTVPQKGEYGNDTWQSDAWKGMGHTNVWAPMSLDAERGLLYLPVSTPSNDFYGVKRPGQGLFGESLVCLDAATGKRKWHFQITHHGLWDYDPPGAPILVTINVDGKKIDAVVQLTKQGFAFVFDRVTGHPVWPIEERPVPASDVPGEHAWPTQPFPSRPPAFEEQGVTLDDALDFTPELKAKAQAALGQYRIGPLYTPPSLNGTIMRPGLIGGANWGGGAFDPETGMLYIRSTNQASLVRVGKPAFKVGEEEADFARIGPTAAEFEHGLPLLKPPYAHLTAIDLNHGAIAWRVPFGDNPQLRKHPALAGVTLPETLGAVGNCGSIVTKGGLVFVGGGDESLHAFDKSTGKDLWSAPVGRKTTGTPMTYRTASGKQFVIVATGGGKESVLVAFSVN
ncbi:MAG TPA: pyrroloquinoline quinone-dependent dehydrogenase [Bryobacteraceae bacterium]|jgi:quinoprotein glucose dehydrogenase